LVITSCVTIRISSDYDTGVDFNSYSTFAFFKPGIDDSQISDLDKRRILNALENNLIEKGFSLSDSPDIMINFHTKSEKNIRISENYWGWGSPFFGPYAGWGMGFNRPYNINTSTSGILYIDIIDSKTKRLVWQGKGVGNIGQKTPQDRENKINSFVRDILTAYPPSN
jgi:hypothetical protein